jgi:hypothetical protein
MKTIIVPIVSTLLGLLQSRTLLHFEIPALRQQLSMLRHRTPKRIRFCWREGFFWVWLYRLWPDCLKTLQVFKPDTLVCFHRKGFRRYWTLKSRRRRGGRPPIDPKVRKLIRIMSRDNIGWGAPRIHGELQILGTQVSQATVAKYMFRHRKPPSQTWRTFLKNHANDLVSIDFFIVPKVTFWILYVFLVLRHDRRQVAYFNAAEHPTACIEHVSMGRTSFRKAEKEILGATHCAIAAQLLKQWRFPGDVVAQISGHHRPWGEKNNGTGASIIFLADVLTKLAGYPSHRDEKEVDLAEFVNSSEFDFVRRKEFELNYEKTGELISEIQELALAEAENVMNSSGNHEALKRDGKSADSNFGLAMAGQRNGHGKTYVG